MSPSNRASTPCTPTRFASVFLCVAGLALALELARVHANAAAGGGPSFCSLGETVNCDRVALSSYSVFLGIPIALWGAFGYVAMLLLSVSGLLRRDASSPWPTGLMVILSGTAAALSIPLALVSGFALRSWCLLCAATWIVDWALFGLTFRRARGVGGAVSAIQHDLLALAKRPARTLVVASAATVVLVAALAAFSRGLTKDAGPRATPSAPAPHRVESGPTARPSLTIFEFSDYECPHCAKAHRELRTALAARPDIHLEHRNFPLDQACNPAVTRPFHRNACALARAAICAGDQGRFWEMNDALFENQAAQRPVGELAARLGLDLTAFGRCQDAPGTARRLDEEIASGLRAGVAATPTYAVGRALYQGTLPAEVLASPR